MMLRPLTGARLSRRFLSIQTTKLSIAGKENATTTKPADRKTQFAAQLEKGPTFDDFVQQGEAPLSPAEALELRPKTVDGRPRKQCVHFEPCFFLHPVDLCFVAFDFQTG